MQISIGNIIKGSSGASGPVDLDSFIMKVDTSLPGTSANNQFSIPTFYGSFFNTHNYNISTSDGQQINNVLGDYTITFPSPGVYTIKITGQFENIWFNNGGDKLKLIDIMQWGTISWGSPSAAQNNGFKQAFYGCSNLVGTFKDTPDVSNVITFGASFTNCSSFIGNLSGMDVSNVVDMSNAFSGCTLFNADISGWDTSSTQYFGATFYNTLNFQAPIGSWDMSSAVNINSMFANSTFDMPLDQWNITSIIDMSNFMNNKIWSTNNYDAALVSWESQGPQTGITVDFGFLTKYTLGSAAAAARASLISTYGWNITDGGGI